MRHHGWELPYHPLQVVVIAVFSSLAFSFYVFFVPFVGSKLLEYHVIAVFSPMVVAVFLLYVRCAAVNPADPGVGCSNFYLKASSSQKLDSAQDVGTHETQSWKEKSLHKVVQNSESQATLPDSKVKARNLAELFCLPFQSLKCWTQCKCAGKNIQGSVTQEELVYCGLCKAEISKCSKHCRACDKCVEGFDHHCRWINNCIGKRNYKTFFSLMTSSLILLFLQWMIGIFVIVRCLLNQRDFKDEIASKLGSSFSFIPFVVVVGLCTILALIATLPLGQLFLFHLILIRKGISTYDYIVAMRELEQRQCAGKDVESRLSSPASSLSTTVSGPSNINALQRKPWCSPPKMLVDSQEPIILEVELGIKASTSVQESPHEKRKRPVRISPWKLAQLNTKDMSRAAARGRERSTILRPASNEESIITETDSSFDGSNRSPAEIVPVSSKKKSKRKPDIPDYFFRDQLPLGKTERKRRIQPPIFNHNRNDNITINPIAAQDEGIASLQSEARSIFRPNVRSSGSRFCASPVERSDFVHKFHYPTAGVQLDQDLATSVGASPSEPTNHWLPMSTNDGYEASGGESADDSENALNVSHTWNKSKSSHYLQKRGIHELSNRSENVTTSELYSGSEVIAERMRKVAMYSMVASNDQRDFKGTWQ